MPASPSPSSILATTALTLSSLDTTFVAYAAAKSAGKPASLARLSTSWVAYFVIGTSSPAAMTLRPDLARSIGVVTPAGLAVGTMIVNLFAANVTGSPWARPSSTSFWGLVVSAARKTSAGAPCSIWVASAADESVEMVRTAPGTSASYATLTSSRTLASDAAPKTVSGTPAAAALALGAPLEQAVTTSNAMLTRTMRRDVTLVTPSQTGSPR